MPIPSTPPEAVLSRRPASIGIVLHDLPLGGTERIALRLAGAWAERGIAVTIFLGHAAGPLAAFIPNAATVVEAVPPIPRTAGSRTRLGHAAARHFSAHPVEALFVIGNYHWEIVPMLATIPSRPAILVQISSPISKLQRGRFAQWRFARRMRRLLRDADALVSLDLVATDEADRIMGRPLTRLIPLPALEDTVRPPLPQPEAPLILAAGRLVPQKDFPTLLRAMARLDIADAKLVIAGSGPDEQALRDLTDRLGIAGRVRFAGYVADIRPLLDEARIFAFSSAYEGFGAVLIEALAAGRPVAACDCAPSVPMLLQGQAWGGIVPVGDDAALAEAMRTLLLAPPFDADAIAATVRDYRLGPAADAYLDLFAERAAR
jgi:glycosyltransferase involved in cell wall biosynthesis